MEYSRDLKKASQAGTRAGLATALQVEIESAEIAQEMISDAEGNEVLDLPSGPLSGEWAGESISELSSQYGIDLENEEVATEFEDAWWTAWRKEIQLRARYVIAEHCKELGFKPEVPYCAVHDLYNCWFAHGPGHADRRRS